MAREKPLFRANLDKLDEAFPGRGVLTRSEVAQYLGVKPSSVSRIFPDKRQGRVRNRLFPKTMIADYLS